MKLSFLTAKQTEDPLILAIELRARYGGGAEAWCEAGILGSDQLSERRVLYRVRDALRLVPADDLIAC